MEQSSGGPPSTLKLAHEPTNPAASRSLPALPSTEQLSAQGTTSSPIKVTESSHPETSRQGEIDIPKNRREGPNDPPLGLYPNTKSHNSTIPLKTFLRPSIPTPIIESPTGSPGTTRRIRVANDNVHLYGNNTSNQAMDHHMELPYLQNEFRRSIGIVRGIWAEFRLYFRFFAMQTSRYLMLRLPSFYFNRVGKVFMESTKDVDFLAQLGNMGGSGRIDANVIHRRGSWRGSEEPNVPENNESKPNLRRDWGGTNDRSPAAPALDLGDPVERINKFISGQLVEEWKTLNIVSALLLTALLTFFQIQEAAFVPVTRTFTFLSLVSAFFSLLFGNLNIIQWSTRHATTASPTKEFRNLEIGVFWNIWVMLSLPFVWLAYSLIFFSVTLMSFLWSSGTGKYTGAPNPPISDKDAIILAPRIAVTVLFGLGTIYLGFIIKTMNI